VAPESDATPDEGHAATQRAPTEPLEEKHATGEEPLETEPADMDVVSLPALVEPSPDTVALVDDEAPVQIEQATTPAAAGVADGADGAGDSDVAAAAADDVDAAPANTAAVTTDESSVPVPASPLVTGGTTSDAELSEEETF
jgi:hypothetical protein